MAKEKVSIEVADGRWNEFKAACRSAGVILHDSTSLGSPGHYGAVIGGERSKVRKLIREYARGYQKSLDKFQESDRVFIRKSR